jgi:hypothetical protein
VRKYPAATDAAAEAIANDYLARVTDGVRMQMFPMAPLTPAWSARKARMGYDSRTLIATGNYLQSFAVRKVGTGQFTVESDARLYKFHEFGTRNMPARPHVGPARDGVKRSQVGRRAFHAVLGL